MEDIDVSSEWLDFLFLTEGGFDSSILYGTIEYIILQ